MRLYLAPMEGLLDFSLRDVLTRVDGIDRCVSEFIRVSGTVLPLRTFTRVVPELTQGSRTPSGVPVRVQLMGSDSACLADNAARLSTLAPAGIDLNFGCPAKVVNRHGGGAVLLDDPDLIGRIVREVRAAVPVHIPVSAKMRLGNRCGSRAVECALSLAAGGIDELVVHGRTKLDGYRPPAYWNRIAEVREAVGIPVIANGEIWSVEDARRCREESGCTSLMLGRGMVADPGLALAIATDGHMSLDWASVQPLLRLFFNHVIGHFEKRQRAGRIKQWLHYLRRRHPQAEMTYAQIRTLSDPSAIGQCLFGDEAQRLATQRSGVDRGQLVDDLRAVGGAHRPCDLHAVAHEYQGGP